MADLTRDLDTAIPRAGKSQVLRTDFPTMPTNEEDKPASPLANLKPFHWVAIVAGLLIVTGIAGKMIFDGTKKPAQQAIVAPVAPVNSSVTPVSPVNAGLTNSGTDATTASGKAADLTKSAVLPGTDKDGEKLKGAEKQIIKLKQDLEAAERPKIASQPKAKKVHKARSESSGEARPAAAAPHHSAASADPFKNLLNSRGY